MDISPHITVALKPEFYKSSMKMDALQPGSTLKLKIIDLTGKRALIDFGTFRTTADIKIPVALGQELTVKVLETGKQLKLGVMNTDQKNLIGSQVSGQRLEAPAADNLSQAQSELSRILNQGQGQTGSPKIPLSVFNVLASLNSHFEPFQINEIITELISRLKAYFENSGIFFEHSLARIISQVREEKDGDSTRNRADLSEIKAVLNRDLKPNLLLLQHFIKEKEILQNIFGPGKLAALKGAIDTLLLDITQQQGRAVRQLESAAPFQVFSFNLPIKEDNQVARLKVFYEKKKTSETRRGFQISLLLSMDRLGDVRTDLFLLSNNLTLTFYVTEPSAKLKIAENFQELEGLLAEFFDQVQVSVKVSEKRVRDFDRQDVQLDDRHRVDLRI
jgi:hypothetical protein